MGDSKVTLDKIGLNKSLALIEYPGLVKNNENMLKTLGGISKISQALSEKKRRLELKFHPDNMYNKPLYGDISETGGLLLKIKIRQPKNSDENPTHAVEILGKCRKVIKFDSLCDYQFLPVVKNPTTDETEYIYDKLVPEPVPNLEWFEKQNDVPLFCLPSMFSRNDSVTQTQNIHRGIQRTSVNNDVIAVIRNKNTDSVDIVQFNLTDPLPTKPDVKVLNRLKIKYVSDEDLQTIKKLFEECPIWNRMSLIHESQVSHDKLKCILPSIAFYFGTGPWRAMYCRYGYDPRKHFESRFYQTFDWRMRREYGLTECINSKRLQTENNYSKVQKPESKNSIALQNVNYPYLEEGRLPGARQCMYRYCDLRFPKIREMVEKVPPPLAGAICNEKIGWLPSGFEEECREIIWSSITELTKSLRQKSHSKLDMEEDDEYSGEEEGIEEQDDYYTQLSQMDVDEIL